VTVPLRVTMRLPNSGSTEEVVWPLEVWSDDPVVSVLATVCSEYR
jgi:hypothetical protein